MNRFYSLQVLSWISVMLVLGMGFSTAPPSSRSASPHYFSEEDGPDKPDDLIAVYLGWQRDPTTTMTVHWITTPDHHSELTYRKAGGTTWNTAIGADRPFPYLRSRRVRHAELTSLEPGTLYEFRMQGFNELYRFRTMPETLDDGISFIVGGDVGTDSAAARMHRQIASRNIDFVIMGGDLAYADGSIGNVARWDRFWAQYEQYLTADGNRLIPLVAAIGNHETRSTYDDKLAHAPTFYSFFVFLQGTHRTVAPFFFSFFTFPGIPGYGALDFSDYLSIISLDTGHTNPVRGTQSSWLEQALEERQEVPYVIPFYHVPAYPSVHRYNSSTSEMIRQVWVPLFEANNVRMAFENHGHTFKRTRPLRGGRVDPSGITYFGDGAWGVEPRYVEAALRWYLAETRTINHVFQIDLNVDRARVKAFDTSGTVFHRSVIRLGESLEPSSEISAGR